MYIFISLYISPYLYNIMVQNLYREFVGCVRCIRILSPLEVQQMSEEGMKLLNSAAVQQMNGGGCS